MQNFSKSTLYLINVKMEIFRILFFRAIIGLVPHIHATGNSINTSCSIMHISVGGIIWLRKKQETLPCGTRMAMRMESSQEKHPDKLL